MKKTCALICIILGGISFCYAETSDANYPAENTTESAAYATGNYTGHFWNEYDFVVIYSNSFNMTIARNNYKGEISTETDQYGNTIVTMYTVTGTLNRQRSELCKGMVDSDGRTFSFLSGFSGTFRKKSIM